MRSLRALERQLLRSATSDAEAAVASRLRGYAHRPVEYVRDCLRRGLTPKQVEIFEKLAKPPYRVLARSANSQGKCVHPEDYIPLADGTMVRARSLVGRAFEVLTLVDGTPRPTAARATADTARPQYRVTLESGEVLTRTGNHPLWSAPSTFRKNFTPRIGVGGWRRCDELRAADVDAVPLQRPHEGVDALTDAEAKFAAYMIGDGGCTTCTLKFTQTDGPQLNEFRELCAGFGFDAVRTGNPIDYRLRRSDRRSDATPGALARKLGFWKTHSRDKKIPAAVFSASQRQQRVFISRLFATDGWASVSRTRRGAAEIGYCSVSETLCRGVLELLSRFGLRATLKDRGNCWCVQMQSAADIRRFAELFDIFGKETAVAAAVDAVSVVTENRGKWRHSNAPAGCRWERVRSIEELPPTESVAITVPETSTFLTCAWEHNTFVAAAKVSHFFDTQRPSITLCTAPTFVQVRDLLFKELRTLRGNDPCFAPKDTRLQRAADDFVHGFTAAKADSFQGRHGVALGIVFDEATGIDPKFWTRGETMFESTGGHWWLSCYNPNDSASPAYLAEQTGTWAQVVLNALEHPNVLAELAGEEPPFPAAIRLSTVLRRMASECQETRAPNPATDFEFPVGSGVFWHPTTPDFEAQILGRWPASPTSALFSPVGLEFARSTARDLNPDWLIAVGCDVARFGDDKTAVCVRCGPCVLRLETHSALNTTQIADLLRRVVHETVAAVRPDAMPDVRDAHARQVPVFVDDTGGYGAGVIDQSNGYNFLGVCNSASPPNGTDKYATTRSYVWCELAAIVVANALDLSRLPAAEYRALADELTAARFRLDSAGRRSVEGKAAIKERLRRSPDRADAVTLAFYGATSE